MGCHGKKAYVIWLKKKGIFSLDKNYIKTLDAETIFRNTIQVDSRHIFIFVDKVFTF